MTDQETKWTYHAMGFNVVQLDADKITLDQFGKHATGQVVVDLRPPPDHVLKAARWGLRYSNDPQCGNILFLDWDHGDIPEAVKRLMLTRRQNNDQESFHGIIRVSDANADWCREFAKRYEMPGLEIFHGTKTMAMFGEYNIKPKYGGGVSKWEWLDDLKQHDKVVTITKEKLGRIFSGHAKKSNKPDNLHNFVLETIPAGAGQRHQAILSKTMTVVKNLLEESARVTIDTVIARMDNGSSPVIQGFRSEYVDGDRKDELSSMIDWCVDHVDDKRGELGLEIIAKSDYTFAHLIGDDDEYNCWHWNSSKKEWSPETGYFILQKLTAMDLPDLKPTKEMAKTIQSQISAYPTTKVWDLGSAEYKAMSRKYVLDSGGRVYDLDNGTLEDVDPRKTFFKNRHLRIPIHDTGSDRFAEFLQDRFPDEKDRGIVLDHLAGGFLHALDLGVKPQALTIQGKPDTWKSLIIEILQGMFGADLIADQSMGNLDENPRWAKWLLGGKFWNLQEEAETVRIQSAKTIKEIITGMGGKAEAKGGGEIEIDRLPRWIVCCNKIQPLPVDDDSESLFVRNQYVQISGITEGSIDWRKELLDEEELGKISRTLLDRAHEIKTNTGDPIRVQTPKESRNKYRRMLLVDIGKFIAECLNIEGVPPNVGTVATHLVKLWNDTQSDEISKKALEAAFAALGHEKKYKIRVWPTSDPQVYDEHGDETSGSPTQQTLIMGLAPKQQHQNKLS